MSNEELVQQNGVEENEDIESGKIKKPDDVIKLEKSKRGLESDVYKLKRQLKEAEERENQYKAALEGAGAQDKDEVVSSLKRKIDELNQENSRKAREAEEREKAILLQSEVNRISSRLFGENANILKKSIQDMLRVADVEGQKVIGVLNENGDVDFTKSMTDFENELKNHPQYKNFIIASHATGSGMRPGNTGYVRNESRAPKTSRELFKEVAAKYMPDLS